MTQFYLYLHFRPDTNEPFYVGKGGGGKRKRSHYFKDRNLHHQNIVAKFGAENIEVMIFNRSSEREAFLDEIVWIKVLRDAGYALCNISDGGEGSSGATKSDEWKKRQSSIMIGNKRGVGRRSAGKETPEHIENKAAAQRGKKRSAESIVKMSEWQLGKPKPSSKLQKGKSKSPEHCLAMKLGWQRRKENINKTASSNNN